MIVQLGTHVKLNKKNNQKKKERVAKSDYRAP